MRHALKRIDARTLKRLYSFVYANLFALLFLNSISILCSVATEKVSQPSAKNEDQDQFLGSQACSSCHQKEYNEWRSSHHHAAMQEANDKTVFGDFEGATFTKDGVTSTFFKKEGRYYVNTDGPDGELADFEIRYTFGITPLQQYLIALQGGRFQALGIAWDSRPKSEGGQRWFHLYPNHELKAGDPLHWTGIDQNWNYQCAWCHSTNLQKNFNSKNQTYQTTWSEINVGCESCHGPASKHIAWVSSNIKQTEDRTKKGFAVRFDERHSVTWPMGQMGQAHRSIPRATSKEIETCAQCHSRRQQFSSQPSNLHSLFDSFRPTTLDQGLYYADGQQRDEVYTYGSFLQSKMHAEGVTCSDCHNPHSGKLLKENNALCAQCHAPERFDTPNHHHHSEKSEGAKCVACHMPTKTYMGVDSRHDHSMRIPRPDRSILLGTPNACTSCHSDQRADWAREAIKAWYPAPQLGAQNFAEAFDLADRQAPGALPALLKIASSPESSAITKASALRRLGGIPTADGTRAATDALRDEHPLVRCAAIYALRLVEPAVRAQLLVPLLKDPSALVRMDAARALSGPTEAELPENERKFFESSLAEYEQAQLHNAERPEAQTTLASLERERGKLDDARAAFRTAIALDKTFVAAAISLADLERSAGNEKVADEILRQSLSTNNNSGPVLHALGLSLIRQKKTEDAIPFLTKAAKNSPDSPRFGYVLAVALHDAGKPNEALEVLQNVLAEHPFDRDALNALVSYSIEMEKFQQAVTALEQLNKLEPNRSEYNHLLEQLQKKLQ